MRLENEVAIVTGSTKGLGRFIAERYAAEGAKVVVTGRSDDIGRKVAAQIATKGSNVIFVRADIMVEEDVKRLIKTTVDTFGKLTIMVNNACPTELVYDATASGKHRTDGTLRNVTTQGWNNLILGTLTQVFWCCKYAAPKLAEAGGGSIINVSSIMGLKATAGLVGYSSGKAALFGLTRSVAVEEAPYGTRCNCVYIGVIPLANRDDGGPPRAAMIEGELGTFGGAMRNAPLLGMGEGEDMANVCLFLGSRESKYLTGLALPIDGGWSIKSFLPSVDLGHQEAQARARTPS